eukprot:g76756.t1
MGIEPETLRDNNHNLRDYTKTGWQITMPSKKKTPAEAAPAEQVPEESAPAEPAPAEPAPAEPAPTTEPASPDGKATPASADGKAEAKSPLDGWGVKKISKIKKTTEAPTRVYVVLKPDYKFLTKCGQNKNQAVPSEGEEPVVRVFRSWASVKCYYIKGNSPWYVKEAIIRGQVLARGAK